MKKSFQSETPQYKTGQAVTPYQRAQQEWDSRIGSATAQSQNWRFVAFLSSLIAVLVLVMLIVSLTMDHDRVFVAQVSQAGRIINVAPLTKPYEPSDAQNEYFIGQFIKMIRGVPLDPVVAKQNWLNAYRFLTQRSSGELNQTMQKNNPALLLGKRTVTIQVDDVNVLSHNTYHFDWTETSVGLNGQDQQVKQYSGVFTVMTQPPKTEANILENPLGIFIVDFHISEREG